MEKCSGKWINYLNNGLWKIVQKYFDPNDKIQYDFFWAVAVLPNYNSFGSHIISTPWQQSWITMNVLERLQPNIGESKEGNDISGISEISVLRKEVNFQYTLRNYSSDLFVQQLYNIYSKIQTHLVVNYTGAEIKVFNEKLKILLRNLLKECSSTAHTLFLQLLQHNFFYTCCESLLKEMEENNTLCGLVVYGLCQTETIQFHLPNVVSLLQTPFRYNLCLLLLASDNITFLQLMIEEDKKLFQNNSKARLESFMENGWQPLKNFSAMVIMERHFLFQFLDLINLHLKEFPALAKNENIPFFIWPVILLQNWNNNTLSEENLLLLIEKCKESTKDKTITQITFILEWYINFRKWYEKHETPEQNELKLNNKQNLLKKAKEHSVLYLINKTTDLSQTDWLQIKDLLNQGKSSDVKSWDIVLFNGYCVLMLVLQTIIISTEIYQLAKAQKIKLSDISYFNESFKLLYKEEVTERVTKVKKILNSLYPLSFRLEILENVFAMIFITFEDVKKLSYYIKGCLDCEKYLEKSFLRSKSVPPEKMSSITLGRSLSLSVPSIIAPEKIEDDGLNKKLKQKGFICRKYIIRDLIYLVKDCLEKLEEDPGSQREEVKTDVPCSIKTTQMINRLDRLSESVSEATWRLQLVTDPEFTSQTGSMQFACGQDPYHHFDGDWSFLYHELDRSGLMKTRKKSAEKPNESGSQSHSSPGNGHLSQDLQNNKIKTPGPAVMNQMLACDASLVVQCLSQGDVLNADHIIQMMSTEENRQNLEGELTFTTAVNDLKKKLKHISIESPVRKSGMDIVSKSRSLQSIQKIANQGVNSTALTNHVERFLSAYTLPSIQSHSKVSAGSVLQCIENTTAMVTIDLALTTAMTLQDFKDLLNIASKHCPELSTRVQSPISAQTTSTKPLGYIVFSQNMIALLQEINRTHVSESDSEIPLHQFIRAHQYPFSLKSLKDNINFWKLIKLAFADFESNRTESKSIINTPEGLLGKCQKNIKDLQKIFESVTKLSESCSDFMDMGKFEGGAVETGKNVNYCDLLSRYLSDLSFFILENVSSKLDDLKEPITLHGLLEQSAVDIVDKLIFRHKIEPGVLEKKAQQLGFNLSASLIAGCCPRLPQTVASSDSSKCPLTDRIVLNEIIPNHKPQVPLHPNQIVEGILSELQIAFQTYSKNKQGDTNGSDGDKNLITENDLSELRNDMKIQTILEKTLEINYIQLRMLKEEETLVFFINLLNLMICHSYLSTKLEKSDGLYSKYLFCRDIAFAFIGYNVGELGFLSIFDVRARIVGPGLFPNFSLTHGDVWSWLKIEYDPRLIFVVSNFTSTSPPLLLFNQTALDKQIINAVDNYVQVSVVVESDCVIISDLLQTYINKEVICENVSNLNKETSKEKIKAEKAKIILKFLIEHTIGELKEKLSNFIPKDEFLKVAPANGEIVFKLEYDVLFVGKKNEEMCSDNWKKRKLSESILRHFCQSSRVLADIVQKVHEAKIPVQTEVARDVLTEEKLKFLDLLFNAHWLQHLAPIFNDNTIIAALSKHPQQENLVRFFQNSARNNDWGKCLDVIFALPDHFVFSDLNVRRFKDLALKEMTITSSQGQINPWYYCEHIYDVKIRMETIFGCCKYWPGPVCISQLRSLLRDNPFLSQEQINEIKSLVKKIKIYNVILEVSPDLDAKTWYEVWSIADLSPKVVIKSLVKNNQLELCLQWISLPGILNAVQQYVNGDFILLFFDNFSQEFDLVDQLINSLLPEKLSEIYNQVIFQLTYVPSISQLVKRAVALEPSPRYRLVEISLEFLFLLEPEEQSRLVHLISHPLLIIEQLLMNTKLDALERVLKKARRITDEELINQEEINKLIVFYASKAVEFDLVKAVKSSEIKLSFLAGTASQICSQEHVIPPEVPDKSQWIADDTVSLCMCCRLVSFSMFNRRHHCRRCGKVVCGSCSTHKMKVAGYKGVAVRVCQTCYLHQTKSNSDMKCSQSTDTYDSSSFTQDIHYWKLSSETSRNSTIREEFSYEHSPNVALCLAIFDLLPDASHSRYLLIVTVSVLLEEIEKMLKILQLNGKSENSEVDCGVVIQIIRSLVVGAKLKYGRAGLISGVDCCDQLLSQVDLIQLLINNHCSSLIPSEPLNNKTLRYLRDKLVEEEMWELAMEVSTKCGLDRCGVWAAWGKVCLTAGSWEEARIKFSHCLSSSPKPIKNPPLVDEICRILESAALFVNPKQGVKALEKGGVAQEVIQVLSTLKSLSQGKSLSPSSAKKSIQCEEQIYYLTTYGSHQALLLFYLKQEDFRTAFTYILDQQLDPELFLNCVLLPSYRSDNHEKFKSELLAVDQSLESFKKYLCYACVFLQKSGYLNTLYDIQILMQDYLRASVTCIHLYQKESFSFSELISRSSYLHTALRHLEEELSVINKKIKRLDYVMKMDAKKINRHMNTIWRQLEAAKFLAGCEAKDKFTPKDIFPEEITKENEMPTLFDSNVERGVVVKLIILLGKNINEGFGIAFRIIQDHQLDLVPIYSSIGKKLADELRINDLKALIECLKTSGMADVTSIVDHVISASIPSLVQNGVSATELETLTKIIRNIDLRITALIETNQLASAYILAAKYDRLCDVQKIMDIADQRGLTVIKKICKNKLNQTVESGINEDEKTIPSCDSG